jgi:hypothetical protein
MLLQLLLLRTADCQQQEATTPFLMSRNQVPTNHIALKQQSDLYHRGFEFFEGIL